MTINQKYAKKTNPKRPKNEQKTEKNEQKRTKTSQISPQKQPHPTQSKPNQTQFQNKNKKFPPTLYVVYCLISPNPHISVNMDVKLGLPGNPIAILKTPFNERLTQLQATKQLSKTKIFFKVFTQPRTISVLQVNKMPHKGIEGTQHVVVAEIVRLPLRLKAKNKGIFGDHAKTEVQIMNTSDFELKKAANQSSQTTERFTRPLENEDDFLSGKLFENLNSTPLGRLLKIIASLPEIRQEKVVNARHSINYNEYETGTRLDMALDKVLEEFLAES